MRDWLMISILLNVACGVALVLARVGRNELRQDLCDATRKADALHQHALELEDKVKALEGSLRAVAPAVDEVIITRIHRGGIREYIEKTIRELGT